MTTPTKPVDVLAVLKHMSYVSDHGRCECPDRCAERERQAHEAIAELIAASAMAYAALRDMRGVYVDEDSNGDFGRIETVLVPNLKAALARCGVRP